MSFFSCAKHLKDTLIELFTDFCMWFSICASDSSCFLALTMWRNFPFWSVFPFLHYVCYFLHTLDSYASSSFPCQVNWYLYSFFDIQIEFSLMCSLLGCWFPQKFRKSYIRSCNISSGQSIVRCQSPITFIWYSI